MLNKCILAVQQQKITGTLSAKAFVALFICYTMNFYIIYFLNLYLFLICIPIYLNTEIYNYCNIKQKRFPATEESILRHSLLESTLLTILLIQKSMTIQIIFK